MATADLDRICGRVVLEQQHVADEAGARVGPLEEVVAEDEVLGQLAGERALKGVDVVDPLADERALVEHILVDVRHGARVGVDARFAGEQTREAGAAGARHGGGDPRLQDRVALDDPTERVVEARTIERMGHGGRELARRVARQLGVAVQDDHIADAAQAPDVADDRGEGAELAAQRSVEVLELAALALPAHPHALARVPQPGAMQQKKRRGPPGREVAGVERQDTLAGAPQQRDVGVHVLAWRVAEVGQQREKEVGIAVGEVTDLERIEQRVDLGDVDQQRGHGDHRALVRRDTGREVEAG